MRDLTENDGQWSSEGRKDPIGPDLARADLMCDNFHAEKDMSSSSTNDTTGTLKEITLVLHEFFKDQELVREPAATTLPADKMAEFVDIVNRSGQPYAAVVPENIKNKQLFLPSKIELSALECPIGSITVATAADYGELEEDADTTSITPSFWS